MSNEWQEEISKATEALAKMPADDPRRVEVLTMRAKAKALAAEDARREVRADVSDAELESRLIELTDEGGEVAVLNAEWNDARRRFPAQVSIRTGQATEPDPRELKARKRFEAAKNEALGIQAELDARRAVEHRNQYIEGRIESELANRGIADDQRLQKMHDTAVEVGLYEDASRIKQALDSPYTERSFALEAAKHAYDEAQQQLEHSGNQIRNVGMIPSDLREQQLAWERDKVVDP